MDFNPRAWYRVTSAAAMGSQLSMVGTFPYLNGDEGFVTYGSSDNSVPAQQWQFFPIGNSTYMLRTKSSGPNGYLATKIIDETRGEIIPRIYNHPKTDSRMAWKVLPWGDGTFYFSNSANGGPRRLDFTASGSMAMSRNSTQPQPGEAFSFVRLHEINDLAFSAVDTPPSSLATSTFLPSTLHSSTVRSTGTASTQTTSPSSTQSRTPAPFVTTSTKIYASGASQARPQPHGLSASASMGVGVTIGVAGIISLSLLAMMLYRRFKKRPSREALHYRRAKMWKGFTPQYRSSQESFESSFGRPKTGCVAELPVPPSPPAVFSPTSRCSSFQGSPLSPFIPQTPLLPPVELPV